MNTVLFLGVTLQVLGAEIAGIAAVAAVLFGYTKIMNFHRS